MIVKGLKKALAKTKKAATDVIDDGVRPLTDKEIAAKLADRPATGYKYVAREDKDGNRIGNTFLMRRERKLNKGKARTKAYKRFRMRARRIGVPGNPIKQYSLKYLATR